MREARNLWICAAVAVVGVTTTLSLADVTWTGDGGDTDWFDPANWSTGVVPGYGDNVVVTGAVTQAAAPVVFDLFAELSITDSEALFGSFTLGRWAPSSAWLYCGSALTEVTRIGELAGGRGILQVARDWETIGADPVWAVEHDMTVGVSGSGAVVIDAGGTVQSGSAAVGQFFRSEGSVDVHNGEWDCDNDLVVGMYGAGELTIRGYTETQAIADVVRVRCNTAIVGFGEGAEGTVDVSYGWVENDDCGMHVTDTLVVGHSGEGTVSVYSRGLLTSGTAIVGGKWELMGPGSGTVTLSSEGRWHNAGDLFIGEWGAGEVTIGSSARLTSADVYLGYAPGAVGGMSVTGRGYEHKEPAIASLLADSVFVGVYGSGRLTLGEYAEAHLTGAVHLGYQGGGEGVCTVGPGTLSAAQLIIGGGESEEFPDPYSMDPPAVLPCAGRLEITDPAADITITDRLVVGAHGVVDAAAGSVIRMEGASLANESVDPAGMDGLLNVNLVFGPTGPDFVTIEAAAEDTGPYVAGMDLAGRFAIGALTIGADPSANVRLVDESENQPSNLTEAVYVDQLVLGGGSVLDLNGLNLYYRTMDDQGATIELNGGSLQRIRLPGDADGDGDVDLGDFLAMKQSFGVPQGATPADGDFNGDGAVDLKDFVILKQNFGAKAATPTGSEG